MAAQASLLSDLVSGSHSGIAGVIACAIYSFPKTNPNINPLQSGSCVTLESDLPNDNSKKKEQEE